VAQDWFTPDEMQRYEATNPCPSWQRPNVTGWCVDKWWAGGPVAALTSALGVAVGMTALGAVALYVSKVEFLQPLVQFFKTSRAQAQAFSTNKRSRRTRRRRNRRR
jgi:hypothetical protein